MTSRAPDRAARAFSAVVRGVTLSDRKMTSCGHSVGLSVEARAAPKFLAFSECYSPGLDVTWRSRRQGGPGSRLGPHLSGLCSVQRSPACARLQRALRAEARVLQAAPQAQAARISLA